MALSVWGRYSGIGLLVALITFVADQLSKYWIVQIFWPQIGCDPLNFAKAHLCQFTVTPFMDFTMAWNKGVSYGLLAQDSDLGRWALIGFSVVAMIGFFFWLAKSVNLILALGIGLIIGGAAGNAVDRVVYEAVADFVLLHAFGYNWYIFNIADVAIVFGAALLFYYLIFIEPKAKTVMNS